MINEKIMCYLTEEANAAVSELVSVGFDSDLALAILERVWPEESIYDVPAREVL